MRVHRGVGLILHSVALALFILAIFARNITGAPNAQIAFSATIYEKSIQGQSAESIEITSDSRRATIQVDEGDVAIFSEDEDRTQYRKTICPDRPIVPDPRSHFHEAKYENFVVVEVSFITIAPFNVHAQAPPKSDLSSQAISHFYFEGASHIESSDDDKCGWGIGFDRVRT